jgi:hypothetical protein
MADEVAPAAAGGPSRPTLGLVITTIGRPRLSALLDSAERSSTRPLAVAVANQSGAPLPVPVDGYSFPVVVVPSSGGVSRGRNDAFAALDPRCEVIGFPNDDSEYRHDVLSAVVAAFAGARPPAAVACRLEDPKGTRFVLPPRGALLTRRTVWRAIEPSMFVHRAAFVAAGGFRPDLGTGAASPWGSGEGTDLLLRLLAAGREVVSRPDLAVHGPGERRELDDRAFIAKHRSYARGTGYVYRIHGYPWSSRLRTAVGPLARATGHDAALGLSLRLALARTLGRLEGLSARSLTPRAGVGRRLQGPQP